MLAVCSACTPTQLAATPASSPPTLAEVSPTLRPVELGLPFHSGAIVDLALLPPQPGEQWRLASGDAEGWVRVWADGELLAASRAHPGGLSALELASDGTWYTAGFDGRLLEWRPESTTPVRAFTLGRPITALAVAGPHLVVSDGRTIQMWSRAEQPQLLWSMVGHGFVTGLALSASGGVVAAAELRQWALSEGIANHPLATFDDAGMRTVDPDEQAQLRALAEQDFPGAVADYVEVWQPGHERGRQLIPSAPIDGDLAVLSRGGVVYREIYDRDNAGLIGRRLEDQAHFPLELVKPWVFWTDAAGHPTEASMGRPNLPAGDFRLGPNEEILVVDHFPGWGAQPPERGWRVGDRRELAIDRHHAAIGDGQGNLAVVAWARPAETGWLAAAEERPDLLTAASGTAQLVTASLEPRTQYRLWSLDSAEHRSIRVEAPWQVLPEEDEERGQDPAAGLPIFPFMLALDAKAQILVTSSSSYSAETQAAVRVIRVADGVPQILTLATAPSGLGLDVGVSPDGAHILAWTPGAAAPSWTASSSAAGWAAGPNALGGAPRFSANGKWSAHVSGFERHIVDLLARKPVVTLAAQPVQQDVGEGTLAAIADDGTLAVVQPFGGGTLERIDIAGQRDSVELPGAATALAWVPSADAPVLVVGFEDGSIARIDAGAAEVQPIHAGAGGRIWEIAAVGGQPGVFVELDDRGLTLHRLVDAATLDLHVSDTTALARYDGSPVQALRGADLVAVWRPGSAMPPCRILDGTRAGVVADEAIERWPVERGPELFEQFFTGSTCTPEPGADQEPSAEPRAAEPVPDHEQAPNATPETDSSSPQG
ncbi:WD domain, G-beta repeat [Enhygromyxa salina]|uniref:WD domain, G-beta repeat n=1 Tax=Enhygromyxa salina TaxID=215803 RepID=A0A2S9XXL8_9BACT|nr:WD domain, G-beta repeat [Enhygromyxa salina]